MRHRPLHRMAENGGGRRNAGDALQEGFSGSIAGAAESVFVSYASQDVDLANRICAALERAGVSCWIAPRNVRAGDLYAQAIVQAINGCRVLLLVLTEHSAASTHVLREVERASSKRRPIICLRTDALALPPALEYFLSVSHWLDAGGAALEPALQKLIEAVRGHLDGSNDLEPGLAAGASAGATPKSALTPGLAPAAAPRPAANRATVVLGLLVLSALLYLFIDRFWRPRAALMPPAAPAVPARFDPPPHSVAVLPFANMSGDPKDEYFSDGLSEELLNSLATIRDLRVAASTSSFSFKGRSADVTEIARKLNVGAILEGSIRRAGQHVRITAQLISARTGYNLWSHSYDRDLQDILKLQSEIAGAVTTALQARLLADSETLVEMGGSQSPQAFDAYLRGVKLIGMPIDAENIHAQLAAYDEAIRLDPRFAKAYLAKALAQVNAATNSAASSAVHGIFDDARAAAQTAVSLAPELGEAHSVLGFVLDTGFQDYKSAAVEHERALALAPGNSRVLSMSGRFLAEIGRADAATASAQRAAALDPLNPAAYRLLGLVLLYTRHYREAIAAYDRTLSIDPQAVQAAANRGLAELAVGDLEAARRSCALPPLDWLSHVCLAVAWHRLNRPAQAESEFAALRASSADEFDLAYQYAQVHAQWGNAPEALRWLETANRVRDPGLNQLKVDSLMDPIRHEPRFQAILAGMHFPD